MHYFLGPHRSGGLNRYAADLAETQLSAGKKVAILYPGGGLLPQKKTRIISRNSYHKIPLYELQGGPPITLLDGIRDPDWVLKRQDCFLSANKIHLFFEEIKPDVFHIHTWMGFPEELLFSLKELGCRIVYTTHDYFGICPKVNLIKDDNTNCTKPSDEECSRCNANAPSSVYFRLRNFAFLYQFKNIINPLKKTFWVANKEIPITKQIKCREYTALRNHYEKLLNACDMIHFNSKITENIYLSFFPELKKKTQVLSIMHKGISDKRKLKPVNKEQIRLCFLGAAAQYKGLSVLLSVLNEVWNEGFHNWVLDVWGTEKQKTNKHNGIPFFFHGRYNAKDLERLLCDKDLVIVPSIWFETFGFVVLEAISYGIPVLCSDTVGAQYLLSKSMIYHGKEELKSKLVSFLKNPSILEQIRIDICSNTSFPLTMKEHEQAIDQLFYKE